MNELLIGYARVSTFEQDLTAQQIALERLGVDPAYIFTDHGLTGTNRARPGLREALTACRNGDTLVVAKLDRLARSPIRIRSSPESNKPLDCVEGAVSFPGRASE